MLLSSLMSEVNCLDRVNSASAVIRQGKVWLKLNGFVIIGNSATVIIVPVVGVAALVVGFGVIRFEFDSLCIFSDGAVIIAFIRVGLPVVKVGLGIVWLDRSL